MKNIPTPIIPTMYFDGELWLGFAESMGIRRHGHWAALAPSEIFEGYEYQEGKSGR
jgi:hypothetical protein